MKLERRYVNEEGHLYLTEGFYGKDRDGEWFLRLRGCHAGTLRKHTVTEHEDGTITVSPSILHHEPVNLGGATRHGFLERGIWQDC